jgi:hypothetical protein
MIKKFIIKIYQAITDFILNNSRNKFRWGDRKGEIK